MHPLLRHQPSADSTNDVVAGWVRTGCSDGQALWVDRQTGGRGRRGRVWVAPPGENLTLSIAVVGARYRPVMLLLPLAAGVGAAAAIAALGVDVRLKWPNDLLVDGRKLGGILCEAVLQGSDFVGAVVGVGVNVNSRPEDLGAGVAPLATSIAVARGAPTDVGLLAAAVRLEVARACDRLASGERTGVLDAWRQRDATAGRRVEAGGAAGTALGIDERGALLVRRDDGTEVAVDSGEVVFL